MPLQTKRAMLEAIEVNPIIVGAYTDRQGGVCPMLAAHRNGGRTSFESFARAWDKYTRAGKGTRRATDRELHTLTTMLQASIELDETHGGEVLGEAIADHHSTQAARARREEHTVPDWPLPSEEYEKAFRELDEANEPEPLATSN